MNIYGDVREMTFSSYDVYANTTKKKLDATTFRFNQDGYLIETIYKDRNDEIWSWTQFIRDETNLISDEFDLNENGIRTKHYLYEYIYDEKLLISSIKKNEKNEIVEKIEYQYDSNNLLIAEIKTNSKDEIKFEKEYIYNAKGILIQEISKSSHFFTSELFKLSDEGIEIGKFYLDEDNNILSEYTYYFNEYGFQIGLDRLEKKTGEIFSSNYELDEYGNIIKVFSPTQYSTKIVEYNYIYGE